MAENGSSNSTGTWSCATFYKFGIGVPASVLVPTGLQHTDEDDSHVVTAKSIRIALRSQTVHHQLFTDLK